MGHWNGFLPVPSADFLDFVEIAGSNPQDNLFCCYLFRPGPLEKVGKFAQSTRTDVLQRRYLLAKLFITSSKNLCAVKSQFTNDFRQKCDLLNVRFDQKNLQTRPDNLQRQARKTAPRTHVGEPTLFQRKGVGSVHTLAKMPVKDLQRVANCRKVDFFIPSQQNLYILLNLKHLIVVGRETEFRQGTAYYGD